MGMTDKRDTGGGNGHEARPENPDERRRRQERSLEQGLEDSFPGSDAINIVQPPPSARDLTKRRKDA